MIDEVWPGIIRVSVPLPDSPLGAVNCYVVLGKPSLWIDSGMDREECFTAVHAALKELGLSVSTVDFFISHLHPDHVGLIPRLAVGGSRVYMGHLDVINLTDAHRWERMRERAVLNGIGDDDLHQTMTELPSRYHEDISSCAFTPLAGGEHLTYGPYTFRCVATPGHSPGHVCLYEQAAGVFISGDHVLGSITPNISGWLYDGNALQEYLDSLDRVVVYQTAVVLPGHRDPFPNLSQRANALKAHHAARSCEVLRIVRRKPQTALEVASHMAWKGPWPSWSSMPSYQKWFAGGEALAHLTYLRGTGHIARHVCGNTAYFGLSCPPSARCHQSTWPISLCR